MIIRAAGFQRIGHTHLRLLLTTPGILTGHNRSIGPRTLTLSKQRSRLFRAADGAPEPPIVDRITSVKNDYVKHCVKLRVNRRYRENVGRVLVAGSVMINELVGSCLDNLAVHALFTLDGELVPFNQQLEQRVSPISVTEKVLSKISGLESVAGLGGVLEVDMPWRHFDPQGINIERLLALEGVQDPGNLGTLLRTASAFRWDSVFLLPGCCDPFNEKAFRSSRGAAFKAPLMSGSWQELGELAQAKGLEILAAEAHPTGDQGDLPPYLTDIEAALSLTQKKGVCLVLGSEGQGLTSESKRFCKPVTIPMAGDMESLNVGIAGGILMYLLSRK